MKKDQCRSCQAPIIWATTTKGSSMPVDYAPTPGGNLIFVDIAPDEVRVLVVGPVDQVPSDLARYTSHFATCEHSAAWRTRERPHRNRESLSSLLSKDLSLGGVEQQGEPDTQV